jgi:hypothetical protein
MKSEGRQDVACANNNAESRELSRGAPSQRHPNVGAQKPEATPSPASGTDEVARSYLTTPKTGRACSVATTNRETVPIAAEIAAD